MCRFLPFLITTNNTVVRMYRTYPRKQDVKSDGPSMLRPSPMPARNSLGGGHFFCGCRRSTAIHCSCGGIYRAKTKDKHPTQPHPTPSNNLQKYGTNTACQVLHVVDTRQPYCLHYSCTILIRVQRVFSNLGTRIFFRGRYIKHPQLIVWHRIQIDYVCVY